MSKLIKCKGFTDGYINNDGDCVPYESHGCNCICNICERFDIRSDKRLSEWTGWLGEWQHCNFFVSIKKH